MAQPTHPEALIEELCEAAYGSDSSELSAEVVVPILQRHGVDDVVVAHSVIGAYSDLKVPRIATRELYVKVLILETSSTFFRFVERKLGSDRLNEVVSHLMESVYREQHVQVPPLAERLGIPVIAVWCIARHAGLDTSGAVIHLKPGDRFTRS